MKKHYPCQWQWQNNLGNSVSIFHFEPIMLQRLGCQILARVTFLCNSGTKNHEERDMATCNRRKHKESNAQPSMDRPLGAYIARISCPSKDCKEQIFVHIQSSVSSRQCNFRDKRITQPLSQKERNQEGQNDSKSTFSIVEIKIIVLCSYQKNHCIQSKKIIVLLYT